MNQHPSYDVFIFSIIRRHLKKKNWSINHFFHNYLILKGMCGVFVFPKLIALKQLLLLYIFISEYFKHNIWRFSYSILYFSDFRLRPNGYWIKCFKSVHFCKSKIINSLGIFQTRPLIIIWLTLNLWVTHVEV